MNANIYVERNGKWEGPYTRDQLRELLTRGIVHLQTFCRQEHDGKQELRTVEFFVGAFATSNAETPPKMPFTSKPSAPPQVSALGLFATLLIIAGVIGLIYFAVFFDTSVPAQADWRVNNLGLMNDRLVGIILSSLSLLAGILITLFGRRK